jgi:hypothetical protein
MPYIIMRRADIPNGVLQIVDLWPNDSQRNYIYDPPGQSGYVRQVPENQLVATSGVGPIITIRNYCGLGAYLIDNVENQAAGEALTPLIANTASAQIIGRAVGGQSVTFADITLILLAAGAGVGTTLTAGTSTGSLAEVLAILAGAKYSLPGGSTIEDGANAFIPGPRGSFESPPHTRLVLQTGAFNISNGDGDLALCKRPDFEWNTVLGPAVTVLANDGTVL